MSTGGVNLQDSFLNQARKESATVEVTLVSGIALQGVVRGFDSFTVVFQVGEKQHLVYKHAIAQVVAERFTRFPASAERDQPRGPAPQQQQQQPGARPSGGGRRREGTGSDRPPRPRREQAPEARPEPFNRIDLSGVRLASVAPAADEAAPAPSEAAARVSHSAVEASAPSPASLADLLASGDGHLAAASAPLAVDAPEGTLPAPGTDAPAPDPAQG